MSPADPVQATDDARFRLLSCDDAYVRLECEGCRCHRLIPLPEFDPDGAYCHFCCCVRRIAYTSDSRRAQYASLPGDSSSSSSAAATNVTRPPATP